MTDFDTVREAVNLAYDPPSEAEAALARIEQLLRDTEAERDEAQRDGQETREHWRAKAHKAEAERDRLVRQMMIKRELLSKDPAPYFAPPSLPSEGASVGNEEGEGAGKTSREAWGTNEDGIVGDGYGGEAALADTSEGRCPGGSMRKPTTKTEDRCVMRGDRNYCRNVVITHSPSRGNLCRKHAISEATRTCMANHQLIWALQMLGFLPKEAQDWS